MISVKEIKGKCKIFPLEIPCISFIGKDKKAKAKVIQVHESKVMVIPKNIFDRIYYDVLNLTPFCRFAPKTRGLHPIPCGNQWEGNGNRCNLRHSACNEWMKWCNHGEWTLELPTGFTRSS